MSFQLRPYQQEAVEMVIQDLAMHNKVGLIMPTGAGKTEVFIEIASRFLAQNPGRCVLILSHLGILTDQTSQRFLKRAPNLKVGVLQGQTMPSATDQVVIGTMQSSRSEDKVHKFKQRSIKKVGLIIVDEAHYIMTESYTKVLSYFPTAKVIGCTATPYRSRAVMTGWFDKVAYSISLRQLISDGFLVPPKLNQIVRISPDTESIMAQVVKIYQDCEAGKNAIVFLQTIDDAKLMRNLFVEKGVACTAVTSEMVGDYRDKVLNSFRAGFTKVLTTVNVLTAGFDSSNIEAIFMPYATSSPTMYMQRIGRGLRLHEGKSECRVYVFGDAPSIANHHYDAVHSKVFGKDVEKVDTFREELASIPEDEVSTEVYMWTNKVVQCIEAFERIGLFTMADMLNKKDFPKKYMANIDDLLNRIPDKRPTVRSSVQPPTDKQKDLLSRYNGFSPGQLAKMTKDEASIFIGMLLNKDVYSDPHVVKSGQFAGTHVSQLSHVYRNIVLKKYPASDVAQTIRDWMKHRSQA